MTTDERIDRLAGMMEERFNKIDERFAKIDQRLDKMDQRFNRLDDYILQFRGEMIRRLDPIEQRMGFLSEAVVNVGPKFLPLEKAILDFGTTASQLAREQSRVIDVHKDLADRVARLEEQVAGLIKPAA